MPRGLNPLQCNEIEASRVIPQECLFLNPTLHFCVTGWAGALIDETDAEHERCRCSLKDRTNQ